MARAIRDNDQRTPAGGDGDGWLWLSGGLVAVIGLTWACINAGLYAAGEALVLNPIDGIFGLVSGAIPWNWASWTMLGTVVVLLIGSLILFSKPAGGKKAKMQATGQTARLMARPAELNGLVGKQAQEKAKRLYSAADKADATTTGLIIGRTVSKPVSDLYMSWEDTAVVLAGQRMGKTQAYVTTSILGAPGACVATANKRDVVDLTRLGREKKGNTWLFDLQGIASDSEIDWWWNPLGMVHNVADARKLASYFSSATKDDGARSDAYFDTAAQDLLANYILAAALGGGDMLHVLEWLKSDLDTSPADILRAKGQTTSAQAVQANINLNPKQKDGIYAMASNFVAVLTDPRYARAVTPPARASLTVEQGEVIAHRGIVTDKQPREFDPLAFVTSSDTLYAMSVEGPDSPAALTTALVGQVIDAGQQVARKIVGGRLETPMVCVLDEAANVVRLGNLPNLYSYVGSQGIVILTFLQSRSQARRRWGEDGVRAMIESSNVVVYGGGIKDTAFLREIQEMIGNMRVARTSTSTGVQTSRSTNYEKQAIMSVDDLAALPSSHAIVMSSGNRPTLATKVFWSMSPFKDLVTESMERATEEAKEGKQAKL